MFFIKFQNKKPFISLELYCINLHFIIWTIYLYQEANRALISGRYCGFNYGLKIQIILLQQVGLLNLIWQEYFSIIQKDVLRYRYSEEEHIN